MPAFFDRKLAEALAHASPDKARDELISLINSVTGGGTGEAYTQLAEVMIQRLRELIGRTQRTASISSHLSKPQKTRRV